MYKELKSIKIKNRFEFDLNDSLEEVCNAPDSASGIFVVDSPAEIGKKVKEVLG